MKKTVVFALFLSFIGVNAFAMVGQTDAERDAHREEMKAIKAAQRQERKNNPAGKSEAAPGFWKKEAERSGLSQTGNPSTFIQNLNPMPFFKSQDEQYKARKAATK